MFLLLSDTSDIHDLTFEQLQYISKNILLREFPSYINELWDKLPESIKVDPEVRQYRRCLEHYNRPWQRTHIDGPAPLVKDCIECRHEKLVADC